MALIDMSDMPLIGMFEELINRGVLDIEVSLAATGEDKQVGIVAAVIETNLV